MSLSSALEACPRACPVAEASIMRARLRGREEWHEGTGSLVEMRPGPRDLPKDRRLILGRFLTAPGPERGQARP